MMRGLAALCFILLGPGARAEVLTPCPATLTVSARVQAPAGFTSYEDGNPARPASSQAVILTLDGADFSEGPPEQYRWLDPDTGGAITDIWHFAGYKKVWISCRYKGTWLLLSKPLPASVSQCQESPIGVSCQ
jgi:hypothetical protein